LRQKDRFAVRIESVAFGGQGVGRIDNFVVFIPFAAPDDVLDVEIVEVKKRFARGRILQILQPSPLREAPVCRYYGRCGGCSYQHIIYDEQLNIKQKQVREVFQKIGGVNEPPVADIIASPRIYSYRGKARMHTEWTKRGRKIGFMDVSGARIIDVGRCEIMEESINQQLLKLRGGERQFTNGDFVIWSHNFSVQAKSKDHLSRAVLGREFLVPRDGFFQANLCLTDRLVSEVRRLAEGNKFNAIVDAYCGSGLFAIFLSPFAGHVIGVEQNQQSVWCAEKNAQSSGLRNVDFISENCLTAFQGGKISADERIDLIVLDPPRVGCEEELLMEIVSRKPEKIIYVSCNPTTQARDVRFMNEKGYTLEMLLPLDMFPQTQHIEVIGLLSRGQ